MTPLIERLAFLFTGKVWYLTDSCTERDICCECGCFLAHDKSIYFTRRAAMSAALEEIEQYADDELHYIVETPNGYELRVRDDDALVHWYNVT